MHAYRHTDIHTQTHLDTYIKATIKNLLQNTNKKTIKNEKIVPEHQNNHFNLQTPRLQTLPQSGKLDY